MDDETILPLQTAAILESIKSLSLRQALQIVVLEQTTSTTDYFRMPELPMWPITVCLAEHQTKGRGRYNRQWQTPFGVNLLCSSLWQRTLSLPAYGLSLVVGLALIQALTQQGISDLKIKWPNDILWQQKKLAGILVEFITYHDLCYPLLSFGLNVNLTASMIEDIEISQPWTSLAQITGQTFDRNKLCATLLEQLFVDFALFCESGLNVFQARWQQYDALKDHNILITQGDTCITGIARGIDAQGYLMVEHPGQQMQAYANGEISVRMRET